MSDEAQAEVQAKLWALCCEKLSAVTKAPIPIEAKVAVFTAVHNWQMNAAIDKQQTERYAKKQAQQDEPATDRQKAYAEDLGIEFADGITKKELSKLINERAR
jgi:hypothetical protein